MSQRGKKFNDDIKEKARALLAINNNAKVVADTLGLKYTTVKTWEKKFLEEQNKTNDSNLVELRNQKKQEFINGAWSIINNSQKIISKRIERALKNENQIDNLINEIENLSNDDFSKDQKKDLYKKLTTIKIEDISKLASILGTIYDKQAVANNEPTSCVDIKLEDLLKRVEGNGDY